MAHRHSRSRLFRPFREVTPAVLFLTTILLQPASVGLRGQTPLPPKEPAPATGESPSQAAHPTIAKSGSPLPGNSLPLKQSAIAYLRRGDFAAAIQAYKHALELDPSDRDLKLGLARALSLSGHQEESKSLYQELLAKTPPRRRRAGGSGTCLSPLGSTPRRALCFRASRGDAPCQS